MDLREYLKTHTLLFDGAMGTYYAAQTHAAHQACELANIIEPTQIAAIHRAYLAAGCQAIKTNTFAANHLNFPGKACSEMIASGYEIAQKAVAQSGTKAFVFADIGPIEAQDELQLKDEYQFVAGEFLKLGAKYFLFETHSTDQGLSETAAYIKGLEPEAFIIVSFASQPDGFTRSGQLVSELIRRAKDDPNIDAVGLNCVSGARHMVDLVQKLQIKGLFSVMPNAGYPTVLGNRTFYGGDPDYFAGQVAALHALGARILGGCCGTTPEHISAVAKAIQSPPPAVATVSSSSVTAPEEVQDAFWEALSDPDQKPFAVELDPPDGADITKFIAGAKELHENGAAIITIADCPVARARMDSSLLACKLHRELKLLALPHMTCRDRNLNATQALLLGLCAEGISNVLIVTGDPIPNASRDEVKSVYNFNSRKLMSYVSNLNTTLLPRPFRIFGALNLNARNFHMQLGLAQQKEECGAIGFLTQPVLTRQALENLKLARQTLKGKILGGIMPVISQRNALFMNSEIAGIKVADEIIAMYEGADREQGEKLAVELSTRIARDMQDYVDGFYLMTPFGRTGLIARIMRQIRQDVLKESEVKG